MFLDDGLATAQPPRLLDRILEAGLDAHPTAPALLDPLQSLTFEQVDRLSDAVASLMRREYHVEPGDRTAFLAEKSITVVVAAIASWKLGAIYTPIDVTSPMKRTDGIMQRIEPALLVSSQACLDRIAGWWPKVPRLSYEQIRALDDRRATALPRARVRPHDAAIIIHTSGSTGVPKGVVLSHGSVAAYFASHNELLGHGPDSRSMNHGPFHFDISVQDTMLPLYFGASVLFHGDVFVSSIVLNLMRTYGVTHLTAMSSVLELISKNTSKIASLRGGPMRVLMTGGELCDPKLIDFWLETIPGLRAFNGYGPTECNSLCMAYEIERPEPGRTEPYPIGRPFARMEALLIDADGRSMPQSNATGVLAMAGPQLMTEYWRDPEQTRTAIRVIDGRRCYVTGDFCRRRDDGLYEFVGRQDAEVKIRGRRINLNEVRNAILNHQHVRFACVRTHQSSDDVSIAAFAYVEDRDTFDMAEFDRILSDRLPPYMQPSYVRFATDLPRTSTTKVDEAAAMELVARSIAAQPSRRYLWIEGISTTR